MKSLKGKSKQLVLLKKSLKLTKEQGEILVGILLGDACLSTQDSKKTYRLHISQTKKHDFYVWHLYNKFIDWVITPPKEKSIEYKTGILAGKSGFKIEFKSVSHSSFRFYAHQFYDVSRKKKVPKLIHKWLTSRGLAYWFMDDGSIKGVKNRGLFLNTQGFCLEDVKKLCIVLHSKFDLQVTPRKTKGKANGKVKEYYQIYISAKSYETFISLVKPYFLEQFNYKLNLVC